MVVSGRRSASSLPRQSTDPLLLYSGLLVGMDVNWLPKLRDSSMLHGNAARRVECVLLIHKNERLQKNLRGYGHDCHTLHHVNPERRSELDNRSCSKCLKCHRRFQEHLYCGIKTTSRAAGVMVSRLDANGSSRFLAINTI